MTPDATDMWTACCDGSASPNPGPMGLGVVLRSPGGDVQTRSVRAEGRGCNNEAELRAILLAVSLALDAGAQHLRLQTDSRIAADHLQPVARPPSIPPSLQALVSEIQSSASALAAFSVAWVPRHRNGKADALSRAALGLSS